MTMVDGTGIAAERYSRGAIAFHWVIAALVLFNLAVGLFHDGLPREWRLMSLHRAVGLTVLVLTLARLGWRLTNRPPSLVAGAPWERALALAAHWGFYILLIAMPLTGWAMSSVGRRGNPPPEISWFFLFDVPHLPVSSGVAGFSHEAHEILGWLMVALVVVHVAAALRHHLILRDVTLTRMLPFLRAPGGTSA
jgi:cytochrome b561